MRIIGLDIRNADDKGENERSLITSDTTTRLLNQEPNRQTKSQLVHFLNQAPTTRSPLVKCLPVGGRHFPSRLESRVHCQLDK